MARRTADRGLPAAIADLHDYLRTGRRLADRRLGPRLESGARALDRSARTRGFVTSAVRPLLHPFDRDRSADDLYVFLSTAADLAASVAAARRQPREGARRASELVVGLSLDLARSGDDRGLVDAFEAGSIDFSGFIGGLADALEDRGVVRAQEYRRVAEEVFDLNALWDARRPAEAQRIAVLAAAAGAGLAIQLYVDALHAVGAYREVPFGKLVPAAARILEGLGRHA